MSGSVTTLFNKVNKAPCTLDLICRGGLKSRCFPRVCEPRSLCRVVAHGTGATPATHTSAPGE